MYPKHLHLQNENYVGVTLWGGGYLEALMLLDSKKIKVN
jgi:hypothetical protein